MKLKRLRYFVFLLMVSEVLASGLSPFGLDFTLRSDLNNDHKVDFYDISTLASEWLANRQHTEEDLLLNATFQRDSVAFLDGGKYEPNAPRKKIMAVCSLSDLNIHYQEEVTGEGMVALVPQYEAGKYIYAKGADSTNIYRSLDGKVWEKTNVNLSDVQYIFGSRTGAILVVAYKGGKMKFFRSVTGGSDLNNGALPEANLVLRSDDGVASVGFYNYHQAANGTICISEYGAHGGLVESRIYRSADDGITFTQVYDETDDVDHSHRIYKHEATGRWIDVYGDTETRNKVVKSDDDGLTWTTLDPQWDNHFQPVDFYDYGHPTNLLYGSDSLGLMGTFDVLTRQVEPVYMDGDRIVPYVFAIYYFKGVFYAGTYCPASDPNDRTAAILVSNDLVHWAVYHNFQNGEYGMRRFIGYRDGKIHGRVRVADGTMPRFSFSPAQVTHLLGWCLDPATTNMLDNNQSSSVEQSTSQWTAVNQMERVTYDSLHGNACLRAYSESGTGITRPDFVEVDMGKTYSGRVFLKANGQNVTGRVRWYITPSSRYGKQNCFFLNHNEWTEIVLEPITIQSGDVFIRMNIRPRSYPWPGPYDYLIDAAQIEELPPSRWQLGGVPRTDEVLYKNVEVPQRWHNILLWSPESRSEWYAGSAEQYIKSWCKDSENYIELYYKPGDSTFCLRVTEANEVLLTLETEPFSFYRNSVIRFEIICSEDALGFELFYAGTREELFADAVDFLKSTELTSKFGDHNGGSLMSCTVLSDKLYLLTYP